MKSLLFVMMIAAWLPAYAQAPDPAPGPAIDAERSRIQAEREKIEERLARDEAACYQKFAVTDCLIQARAVRREAVADLRRQEISINAAEARRRGAEQLSRIEEKSSAEALAQEAQRREQALQEQSERQRTFDEKAANRAQEADKAARLQESADKAAAAAQKKADQAAKARDATAAQKAFDDKLKDAELRKAQRQKRLADAPKVPPKPLPPTAPQAAPQPAK
jgi:hypothetical protein